MFQRNTPLTNQDAFAVMKAKGCLRYHDPVDEITELTSVQGLRICLACALPLRVLDPGSCKLSILLQQTQPLYAFFRRKLHTSKALTNTVGFTKNFTRQMEEDFISYILEHSIRDQCLLSQPFHTLAVPGAIASYLRGQGTLINIQWVVLSCYIYDPQGVIKSSTIVSGVRAFYEKTCGTPLGQDSWGCSLNVDTNPEPSHSQHHEHLGNALQASSPYETE